LARLPSIAVGPDGAVLVAWVAATAPPRWQVRVSRSTDGGARFSEAVDISDGGGPDTRDAAVAAGGDDKRAVIAWVECGPNPNGATDNRVRAQLLNPDGTRDGANVAVNTAGESPVVDAVALAIDPGNPARVYVGYATGSPAMDWDARAAASIDGGKS